MEKRVMNAKRFRQTANVNSWSDDRNFPGNCSRMPAYKDLWFKADYRQIQDGGAARDKKAGQSP